MSEVHQLKISGPHYRREIHRRQFIARGGRLLAAGLVTSKFLWRTKSLYAETTDPLYPENYGVDVNNASEGIQDAINAAGYGGVVELGAAGPWGQNWSYRFNSTIFVQPGVTLRAISREVQLLSGGNGARIELENDADLMTVAIAPFHPTVLAPDTPGVLTASNGWTINDVLVSGLNGYGILVAGSSNFQITGSASDYNGWDGIVITANHQAGIPAQYGTIANNVCQGNKLNGIDCNASDCTIQGNTCNWNGQTTSGTPDKNGIIICSIAPFPAHRNVVTGNTCWWNRRNGIFIGGGDMNEDDNEISNNFCEYNEAAGLMMEAEGIGAYNPGIRINRLTANNNQCKNNFGKGFFRTDDYVHLSSFLGNNSCNNGEEEYFHLDPLDSSNTICG